GGNGGFQKSNSHGKSPRKKSVIAGPQTRRKPGGKEREPGGGPRGPQPLDPASTFSRRASPTFQKPLYFRVIPRFFRACARPHTGFPFDATGNRPPILATPGPGPDSNRAPY